MARFSDYEVRSELARGSMGVVFRAYDPARGCDVALKRLIAPQSALDVQRFRVEVAATRRLRHPHIVGVHCAGEDDGLWLAMDLVEGESLFERLQRGPLPWGHVQRIGLQLCGALAHAHQLGVLHRDLKPHNVLLDRHGDAHLTDFGLAQLVGNDVKLTREGDVLGTPVYMAPEQALGQRTRVSARSDLYGLGATLFHAATGRPPFWDRQISALLHKVVHAPAPAPSGLEPTVPAWLDAVILRCLAKAPAARFGSAEELGEALSLPEASLSEAGDAAPPSSLRSAALGAVAGAGLALGVLGAAWWTLIVAPPEGPAAPEAPAAPEGRVASEEPTASEGPAASGDESQPEATPPSPAPVAPPASLDSVSESYHRFETQRAVAGARELVRRDPEDGRAQLLLAVSEADFGRFDAAWAALQRAFELEPGLRRRLNPRHAELIQGYAEQTPFRGEALPARWEQAFGGSWRVEPDGEIFVRGGGLGTYQLSALFDRDADSLPSYRLEVEVNRDLRGDGERLQSYGGVILGARNRGDFYTVFFVQNRRETEDVLRESGGAAGYAARHGVEPVLLRVTHQNGEQWEFPARYGKLVPPQRSPWSKLVLEVERRRLQAWVDGEAILDLELARPLDGRVGLLKYYMQEFRFRNWSLTPLR